MHPEEGKAVGFGFTEQKLSLSSMSPPRSHQDQVRLDASKTYADNKEL